MTIYAKLPVFSQSTYRCIGLVFCWCIGLLVGYYIYEPSFHSLMHGAVFQPVSIVGVFVCIYLPLICSYFSFLTDKPIIIMVVCFLKAVAFGFSGTLISHSFQSAGWLACFLLLFSDSCFLCVLLFLWLRRFMNLNSQSMTDIYVCTAVGSAIAMVDSLVIFPFLRGLL